jgi:hypothetical protein
MTNSINQGSRIRLIHTNDPYTKLENGSEGTVLSTRHDGFSNTISVEWDDGSSLSLIEGEDQWELVFP